MRETIFGKWTETDGFADLDRKMENDDHDKNKKREGERARASKRNERAIVRNIRLHEN